MDRLLALLGLVAAVAAWILVVRYAQGYDTHSYWAVNAADPYAVPYGAVDAFSYSPAVASVFQFARVLPFPVFYGLWTAMLIGIVLWLVPRRWWALAIVGALFELFIGNVHLVIAGGMVLGLTRTAAWWSMPILLKATPGVGLVWHLARHEWRQLIEAAGITLLFAAISFVVAPTLWSEWLRYLTASSGVESVTSELIDNRIGILLIVRLPFAALVIAYAARSDRRWLVAVGVLLATPALWITAAVVLYAIPRLRGAGRESDELHERERGAVPHELRLPAARNPAVS